MALDSLDITVRVPCEGMDRGMDQDQDSPLDLIRSDNMLGQYSERNMTRSLAADLAEP